MARNETRFQEGLTYVSRQPDLALTLENQEGNFRVAVGVNTVFHVQCEGGHSIKSMIPAGQEVNWIIEKKEPTSIQTPDELRHRTEREREYQRSTS